MVIFLLTAVPIFYLTISSLLSDSHGRINDSYKPFVYGFICFIAGVIIYNIIRLLFLSPVYTVRGLYIYYLLHDSLIQYVMALAGYLLVFGFTDFELSHHSVSRLFAFLCGYYCLWSINDIVINYGWYNSHVLLIIPFQRIGLIAALSFFLSEALKQSGALKILMYFLCIVLPFITAAGSLLWRLSLVFPTIAVTAALPVISCILLYYKLKPEGRSEEKIRLA